MANLLSNPNNWTDDAGHSPPSYWNGTSYVFNDAPSGGPRQSITYNGTASAGDTCSALMNNLVADGGSGFATIVQMLDLHGAPASPYYTNGTDMESVGSWQITTGTLRGGETIQIYADSQNLAAYAYDFTLTPPPAPILLLRESPNPNFVNAPVVLVGTSTTAPFILSMPS